MAHTISVINGTGLFSPAGDYSKIISEEGNNITVKANVPQTKDPLFCMVDLSATAGPDIDLIIKGVDGHGDASLTLIMGKFNIIPITTKGFKDSEDNITMELVSENMAISASSKINVMVYSHTPVVNH